MADIWRLDLLSPSLLKTQSQTQDNSPEESSTLRDSLKIYRDIEVKEIAWEEVRTKKKEHFLRRDC